MTTVLHIDSSARGDQSTTRQLTRHAVDILKKNHKNIQVIYRDLTINPLKHLGPETLAAFFSKTPGPLSEELKVSTALIDELKAADIFVIGVPMYNFNIPSQLKSWIDNICRAGITFQYSATGPQGLLKGKKAIVAVGTGGVYSSGAMVSYDHVVSYMKQVLGFIGITDVTIVMAEKQGMGADVAASELSRAQAQLDDKLTIAA